MKYLTPLFLILIAVIIFFVGIKPQFADVKEIYAEQNEYEEALEKAQQLEERRDKLVAQYNSFSAEELQTLETIAPESVSNTDLAVDIDAFASQYGIALDEISVSNEQSSEEDPYSSAVFDISFSSDYGDFISFLRDLEDNVRVIDITSISFNSSSRDAEGVYQFDVSFKAYWLNVENI